MAHHGKRVLKAREGVERTKLYKLEDAVKLVKTNASAKFDETVELAINLGVDPKHADQMVRGVVNLPNGTGRTLRVAVFARGAKADEARAAGADVVGAEDLVAAVQGGEINFDRCIATPDMMPLVGRLGKVLGPRGLMPNPKVGTVTMDVKAAVAASKGGAVEFRAEKAGIVQGSVGKASFGDEKLAENIKAFVDAVNKAKPAGAKGHYLLRAAVSSTMGPGVRLDLATLQTAGQTGRPNKRAARTGRGQFCHPRASGGPGRRALAIERVRSIISGSPLSRGRHWAVAARACPSPPALRRAARCRALFRLCRSTTRCRRFAPRSRRIRTPCSSRRPARERRRVRRSRFSTSPGPGASASCCSSRAASPPAPPPPAWLRRWARKSARRSACACACKAWCRSAPASRSSPRACSPA